MQSLDAIVAAFICVKIHPNRAYYSYTFVCSWVAFPKAVSSPKTQQCAWRKVVVGW